MDLPTSTVVTFLFLVIATIHVVLGTTKMTNMTRGPTYEHPLRTSDLMCYVCINEVKSDNCITMANSSKIWVLRCKEKETFCKVRRFETKGELTTFDRHCAEDCTPGCGQGIINEECVSCCQTPLCNTDNGAGPRAGPTAVAARLVVAVGVGVLVWIRK